jgi:hypothetical protein
MMVESECEDRPSSRVGFDLEISEDGVDDEVSVTAGGLSRGRDRRAHLKYYFEKAFDLWFCQC